MGAGGGGIDATLFDIETKLAVDEVKALVKFDRKEGSVCFGSSNGTVSLGASLAFASSAPFGFSLGFSTKGSTVGSGIGLQKLSIHKKRNHIHG